MRIFNERRSYISYSLKNISSKLTYNAVKKNTCVENIGELVQAFKLTESYIFVQGESENKLSKTRMDMNLSKVWETVKDKGAWHAAIHGVTESNMT